MNKIICVIALLLFIHDPFASHAQTFNWGSLKKDQQHLISGYAGVEYGVVFGVGYSYQLKSRWPVLLSAEYSFPSGEKLFDDFKTKIGGQVKLYQSGKFHFVGNIYGVFRGYGSDFVRLLNFGADISAIAGYYKQKWFVAGKAGFDKAIITHFKHTDSYKTLFPMARDGWYEPSTGGNFYYGLQTGYSFFKTDIYLETGKIVTQDFKTEPLIPFYLRLGFNWKIKR